MLFGFCCFVFLNTENTVCADFRWDTAALCQQNKGVLFHSVDLVNNILEVVSMDSAFLDTRCWVPPELKAKKTRASAHAHTWYTQRSASSGLKYTHTHTHNGRLAMLSNPFLCTRTCLSNITESRQRRKTFAEQRKVLIRKRLLVTLCLFF